MILIDQIRDLIAEGETERSLDELYNYVKTNNADVIDNLVMLQSRMKKLRQSISNGTIDNQDADLERAKINEAILKLLPQLTPEYLAEASKRKAPLEYKASTATAPARNKKLVYIALGAVALLVLIMLALNSGDGSPSVDQQEPATEQGIDNQASPENAVPSDNAVPEENTMPEENTDNQPSNSEEQAVDTMEAEQ